MTNHKCYMDGIDWQYHLESDEEGTKLYPNEESLKNDCGHDLTRCGIVEVEVKLIRWVKPQTRI